MSRSLSLTACVCSSLALLFSPAAATAQVYPGCNPCPCLQPVAQTVYRSVPVTEYQQVKQVVQRPVVETKWVDREVTEYRPVTETRTASVPTVSYENVTQCQTVQRNAGYWATQYNRNPKLSPCQYDSRPNLFGSLNRMSYSIRQAFTPNIITRRQYVPRVVTQVVPVTRQVARHGTRQVTYNVTRMVAYKTTRKVAVNTVRYVSQEITTTRPVTVMRSVPVGTRVTYAPIGGVTATALSPTPDPISRADNSATNRKRTADSRNDDGFEPVERFRREETDNLGTQIESSSPVRPASFTVPTRSAAKQVTPQTVNDDRYEGYRPVDDSRSTTKFPSIIRVSRGWSPRHQTSTRPQLAKSGVTLARTNR